MAGSTRRKPAGKPKDAAKQPVEAPDVNEEEAESPLVKPLAPDAFQFVMQIIDNSDFKGRDLQSVLLLKRELARVANVQTVPRK